MWRSLTSSIILLLLLALMTALQACTKYHDNGNLGKPEIHSRDTGPYGGPYSGKGPRGGGVK